MSNEIFPDAVQILDLYHLKENVYKFAKHILNDSAEIVKWAEIIIDKIENHYAVDESACHDSVY